MKRFCINNYRLIVIVSWVLILLLLWLQYIYLASLLAATLLLIVHFPVACLSIVLTNKWLPKAMQRRRLGLFSLQFVGVTLFISFILAANFQLMGWAETEGYFPHSLLLANHSSLAIDFLFAIPMVLVINFGFCGLRFLYEHMTLQNVHLKTQLQFLQSQINPHFMFNVLNHIQMLMQTNVELASDLLLQYSEMLRFQLYKGKSDRIYLEEEVLFLKNFVEIEKLRWGNKIKVNCNWDIADKKMMIPPLLLFPLVENAFKYASRTIAKEGFVTIELKYADGNFSFVVQNSKSISSCHKDKEANGIGLDNTRKRLDLHFEGSYRLSIEDEENTYYIKLEIWRM